MTCHAGGRGDCDYPNHACVGDGGCDFTISRRRSQTGLNSPMWGWSGVAFLIGGLLGVLALYGAYA